MPFYSYFCATCEQEFRVFHGMDEEQEYCTSCGAKNCLERVYDKASVTIKNQKKQTSSERVDEFIKDSRRALEQQKREASKDYD